MKLSENFTLEEFERSNTAERLGIDNRVPQELMESLRYGCENILQPLRDWFGRINLKSGYRCPELNWRIGGSENSQHMRAEAGDIRSSEYTEYALACYIDQEGLPYDQLIIEYSRVTGSRWVHVSWTMHGTPRREKLTAIVRKKDTIYKPGLHG